MMSKIKPEHFISKMTVAGIIFTCGDEVLILKRSPFKKKGANHWAICAGKCEERETPLIGIQREVEEEIGISLPLSEIKHFDTYYFHPDDEPDYTLLWEVFSYDFLEKPTVILNAEHSEYVWAKRNDVFSYAMIESEDELFKDFFNINK